MKQNSTDFKISKERAIEVALLYLPSCLGDEWIYGVTDEDLEETPKILESLLPKNYKRTIK